MNSLFVILNPSTRFARSGQAAPSAVKNLWLDLPGSIRRSLAALGMTGMIGIIAFPAIAQQDLLSADLPPGNVRIDQHLGRQIPRDLEFRDETGRSVRIGDYFKGKPVIITPVYYRCPMLCNVVLEGVVNTLRELRFDAGKEFEVVTVSFDPRETPADAAKKKETIIRHYGREGAAEGWHFLTGDSKNVSALMTSLGFRYQWDPKISQWAHGATIVVATPDAYIARYFFGITYPPRDVRLGLVEASGGKIGSPIDQLLLLCYHYDPATGKYSAYAMNVVRAGSTLTVAGIAGFIIIMLRRERRSPKA